MPHTPGHKRRIEDIFWQSPIPEPSLLPMAPNIGTGLFDEEFNETPDERMFRENEEFYKKHPTDTLELSPTGHTTQYGRKVYKDQFGAIHSESTTTIESPEGGWMNIPVIYNGRYVSPDQARAIIIKNGMVDPETGEKVRSYESIPKAEEAAKQRMRTLNKKDQPWNQSAPKKDGSFLDWLIPKAGAAERAGIMPQEKENLFNAGFGEFQQETYRYGNPPPTLKLGMLKYPDAAHVVDLGISDKYRISTLRGRAGHADTGSTTGELLELIRDPDTGKGYKSARKYYDDQKKKGHIREGLSFEDWEKTFKTLREKERYVAMPAQAEDALRPSVWSHEFAHLGQFATPESGSGKEARQRMRDIMYPSLRHPEEIEEDLQYLEGQGYEIGGKDWMQLYENAKLEDEYANKQLEAMGKTPGGTPNLQVLEDWLEGGRTKEGYKEVILRRRRENLPGLMGMWHKTIGLFD